jgi:hypothetical protein
MSEARKRKVGVKMPGNYVRPTFPIAIRVMGGFVWEHDVDESGGATSDLRPHYQPEHEGYPKDGYPTTEELRAMLNSDHIRGEAEKKAAAEEK